MEGSTPTASVPPPPPSRRPLSERPVTLGTSPLPPPVSAPVSTRPILPKAPPAQRIGKQQPSEADFKRLEEENQGLRNKLTAARDENKVEQKNIERLRGEIAQMKAKAAASRPSLTMIPRTEVDRIRTNHSQEIREIKRKHQSELDQVIQSHRVEITRVKSQLQAELSQLNKKVAAETKQAPQASVQHLEALKRELEDLRQKTAAFRQKNTELREANGELERRLQEAEERAASQPTGSGGAQGDDLTELKGVGPKVAQALRAAGITRFEQIAAWTEADIENVAPKIKTAASRIKNNDWVAQAKRRLS